MNEKYISFEIVAVKDSNEKITYNIIGNKKFEVANAFSSSREDYFKKNKVVLGSFSSLKEAQDNFLRIKDEV